MRNCVQINMQNSVLKCLQYRINLVYYIYRELNMNQKIENLKKLILKINDIRQLAEVYEERDIEMFLSPIATYLKGRIEWEKKQ